jgi:O-acetyl-ADP-ribose deacetylase (regulator of RNase III)
MAGHLFIACGDITDLYADAIAYSTSTDLDGGGHLHASFARAVPDFQAVLDDVRREAAGQCEVGQAFWRRLAGPGREVRPRGLVVVAAAGGGRAGTNESERDRRSRLSVRNAVAAAAEGLRRDFPDVKRPLVTLPAFRLGRGGDRRRMLRSARVQVEEARDALARHGDLDVAFVTYTEDVYRVFLQARRELLGPPRCPLEDPERVELVESRLVPALRQQRGVLFLGAGLSQGGGLDSWAPLTRRLADKLDYRLGDNFDLDLSLQLAQWYADEFGRDRLTGLMRQLYGGLAEPRGRPEVRPTLSHYLLLALPLRLVVTTNYDCLIERALRGLRRDPRVVVEGSHVVQVGVGERPCVVKFHGDAESGRHIVLSESDYDTFFETHPVLSMLLEGLLLNHTFLFAGYRLRDPNFRQIYGRVARLLADADRHAFALDVGPANRHAIRSWRQQHLHLLPMPGGDEAERVRASGLFLDWLADQVVAGDAAGVPAEEQSTVTTLPPALFLLESVRISGPLEPLRRTLLDDVGRQVEEAYERGRCSADEARTLAAVLECLTRLGWRPQGRGLALWQLWQWLAANADQLAERMRLLRAALRHTNDLKQAEHVRRLLDAETAAADEGGG